MVSKALSLAAVRQRYCVAPDLRRTISFMTCCHVRSDTIGLPRQR
jgi:hypothetical protein